VFACFFNLIYAKNKDSSSYRQEIPEDWWQEIKAAQGWTGSFQFPRVR